MAIENGRGSSPSLGREEARAVAELAKRVERSRGGSPQDLEWAIEDGGDGPVLLQARPETVWASKRASSQPSNEGSDQPKSALDHVLGAFVRPPRK
jgi:phosphoenolpyruvate synthase/pyruvate phosphate dikinase